MTGQLLLALDVGTGSCRAVLFSADGSQVAIGQREYSHWREPGIEGSQRFDTARNWQLICECIQAAFAGAQLGPDAVQAVATTSMREGMVLYDSQDREIWACPNVDSRAGDEAARLVQSGEAEEIYRLAGDWVSITAPARFLWLAHHAPSVFRSIAHVGMLGDWITHRLTGEYVTDPSLGSSSGMFDLAERRWSERVLDICGIGVESFPPVADPGTVVGAVSAQAAIETGIRRGTPVVVGGADTQLALAGLGITEPGAFTVVGGSFWQHTVVLDRPLIDPERRLRTLCHTVPRRWMMEGIGFYSGIVMRWFRDAFCEPQRNAAGAAGDAYSLLEDQAARIAPGANGVFGLFSNLMQANRWLHASPAFIGFDIGGRPEDARAEFFRAIEESAAFVSRGHLGVIEEVAELTVKDAVLTGGAAKGSLWPQIVADTLGKPVRIPEVTESTALGAAIYAGVGAGLYEDAPSAGRALVRFERTFMPRPALTAIYDELYDRWIEIYRRSLEISEAGLVRPLWRAAGT